MKKTRLGHTKTFKKNKPIQGKEITTETSKTLSNDLLDEEDTGFGGWLKSVEGLETMKLFVAANSIILLTTLAYPHVQLVLDLVADVLYGPDPLY